MAQKTYLQLVNSVLRKIVQTPLASGISSAGGHAQIIAGLINDAQRELFAQANWHSLLTSRSIAVVSTTDLYALASNHGETLSMRDSTNGYLLKEGTPLMFDLSDPTATQTGPPTHYAIVGNNFQLFPYPSGSGTIVERYFKYPATLSGDSDVSDLPVECESCLEYWALAEICATHLNNMERAGWALRAYKESLASALRVNREKINRILTMLSAQEVVGNRAGLLPTFPLSYGTEVELY